MHNFSIRQILYFTFGGLLLLTLVVIYAGFRHSVQTVSFINTIIDHHGPILKQIDEVENLLQKTDETFHLRALQSEITRDDILALCTRLEEIADSLIKKSEPDLKKQLEDTKQSITQIVDAQSQQQKLQYLEQLKSQFDITRQILYRIYNGLSVEEMTTGVAGTINTIGDISTEIEIQIQQFVDQDLLQPEQVIAPLEEASELLDKIRHPDSLGLKLSDNIAGRLEVLSIAVKRLKSAILFYDDESARLDPSEAHVERAKIQINEMRKLVLEQISILSSNLRAEIQLSQTRLAESSRQNQQLFLVLSVIAILLAISIGYVISRLITNATRVLERSATEFAKGNLDHRVLPLRIREFSSFAILFNRMASSIDSKHTKILETLKSLNEINAELDQRVIERTADMEAAVQKAEQANTAKSLFLSNMTHELRTPMHAILGFSEIGSGKIRSAKADDIARYFQRITESGTRLLALIDDLLDLSKLESGKVEYNSKFQNLEPVFESVAGELENLLKAKNIKLDFPAERDFEFYFDRCKIHQVLINLLSNAIKFSPKDSSIGISCQWCSLPSGYRYNDRDTIPAIEIVISDQGVGIPAGQLDAIFDPFIQSSVTRTRAGGTGLGLSICRQIIQGHHGTIKVESRVNVGSDFIIRLPQANPAFVSSIRQMKAI